MKECLQCPFKWLASVMPASRACNYLQNVVATTYKKFLQFYAKRSCKKQSFYYMGQFDILEARNAQKEDNRGRMQPITKVTMKMHHAVREDLLRYLQSHITV